jgi:8-oxo-dGTP diphosphatase
MKKDPTLNFEKPFTTVDVVVFSLLENKLNVLLIKRDKAATPFPETWSLVGGFVDIEKDDHLEATALRKLQEKTGVQTAYLEQLGSWGSATRDPRGWCATHVYFSMLPIGQVQIPQHGANAADAKWFAVEGVGVPCTLAFDHQELLTAAIQRLRNKVEYTSLPAFLMPERFTLKELQTAFEAILARPLDKSAFRTRMLAADFLQETQNFKEAANRPALLYTLKDKAEPVYFSRQFKSA